MHEIEKYKGVLKNIIGEKYGKYSLIWSLADSQLEMLPRNYVLYGKYSLIWSLADSQLEMLPRNYVLYPS